MFQFSQLLISKSQLTIIQILTKNSIPDTHSMFVFSRFICRHALFKKKPEVSFIEELQTAVNSSANLSYIPKQIILKNQVKPKILPPQLPQYKNKLTVVLELDEVISYTFTPDEEGYLRAPLRKHDFYTEYEEYDACLSVYKRKNLQNFLNYLSQECQPILWSTGVPSYVELVMNFIDPQKKIPYRLTQDHCDLVENAEQQLDLFVKDLNLLGRDLQKVVYIDSKPLSYWMYPDNCYPIEDFKADMTMESQDLNLLILQLQALKENKDVRTVLRQRFKLRELLKGANLL